MTIFDTYGDDVTNIEHQVIHFNWAWNRTIDNFIDESLDFEEDKLYNYLEFTLEMFYSIPNKTKWENNRILNIWVEIFDYTKRKTNSDIDVLIEIYIIFEKALKSYKKKVLLFILPKIYLVLQYGNRLTQIIIMSLSLDIIKLKIH
jgi:hypothetical protein